MTNNEWYQKLIKQDRDGFGFVCFSVMGEYLALVESLDEAKVVIDDYLKYHNHY